MLLILLTTSPNVIGIELNLVLISSDIANTAFFITSDVINPSLLISFKSPIDFPVYLLIAWANKGAFSIILLNSSPCNFPEAIAWVNWYIPEVCSWVEAPPTLKDLAINSENFTVSILLLNAWGANKPNLETTLAVSKKPALEFLADWNIACCNWSVVCFPSFIKSNLAIVCDKLSETSNPILKVCIPA